MSFLCHTAAVRVDPAAVHRPVVRVYGSSMAPNMPWYYCVPGPRGSSSPSGSCTHGIMECWDGCRVLLYFCLGSCFVVVSVCLSMCGNALPMDIHIYIYWKSTIKKFILVRSGLVLWASGKELRKTTRRISLNRKER